MDEACTEFDWSGIGPTIFGVLFESTLNSEIRRSGEMHYTSIVKILKVIDPLFLDDLKHQLIKIIESENIRSLRTKALNRFIKKLSKIKVLDPACGNGNFLTKTFLSLKSLKNEALSEITKGQMQFVVEENTSVRISIDQLYGIGINDFTVAVANIALIITQNQMLKETETILQKNIGFLPLQAFENTHEGNALSIDWNDVIPVDEYNYIIGNPTFAGRRYRTPQQIKNISRFLITKISITAPVGLKKRFII